MLPLISILIPTCQRLPYLRAAIASVRTNGWERFEIIVSEDRPDGSVAQFVEELGDVRVRYTVHPPPAGMLANWQHAALRAQGEFICKLDDDDLLCPGFLQTCAEFLLSHSEAASVYTAHETFTVEARPGEAVVDTHFFPPRGNLVPGAAYIRAVLKNQGGFPRNHKSLVFYRRTAAEKIDFYAWAQEDFVFGAALALQGAVGYVPQVLCRWRSHSGNAAKNYLRTWRSSRSALIMAREITFYGGESLPVTEWREALVSCRRLLPLYYYIAALRDGENESARALYQTISKEAPEDLTRKSLFYLLEGLSKIGGKRLIFSLQAVYIKMCKK